MAARLPRRTVCQSPSSRCCGSASCWQAPGSATRSAVSPGPAGVARALVALGVIYSGPGSVTSSAASSAVERSMRCPDGARRCGTVPAEQIVAGFFGALLGCCGGAGDRLAGLPDRSRGGRRPALRLRRCSRAAMLGYRIGSLRRDAMLAMFGAGAGMAPATGPRPPRYRGSWTPSVAIDGRIVDVVRAGFLGGRMVVIQPVLDELQGLADASDDLRRGKGRRGLQMLEALRRSPASRWRSSTTWHPASGGGRQARPHCPGHRLGAADPRQQPRPLAALGGVRVLNLHALTLAMRPTVVAGDEVSVLLTKAGKEAGQAVGYLDDGTMVVVERARSGLGQDALVQVTSVLTTANGRMVFARPVVLDGQPVGGR